MPRYVNDTGWVAELTEEYVSVFPAGTYERVPDDTPLSYMGCCGETGPQNLYERPRGKAPRHRAESAPVAGKE